MAVDYFLRIEGIQGESVDKQHKDEIELLSFSWGLAQTGGLAPGGGGAGKASFQDFHFVARTSKASPKLFHACASGQHLKNAVLTCRRGGAKAQAEFLEIGFRDVLVSSCQVGGSAPEEPLDQVSLAFARIEVEYTPFGPSGKAEPPLKAGWDLKANKKL